VIAVATVQITTNVWRVLTAARSMQVQRGPSERRAPNGARIA
jgi:hypothetical protein